MKAAVYERYGPPEVVQIAEVPKPVPGEREVLIRIRAATVCAADWRFRSAQPALIRMINGLRRPRKVKILGVEFSGDVAAIGPGVTRFAVGDAVFGSSDFSFGTHAEYVCLGESKGLALKPAAMRYEEATAVAFGGLSALQALRLAGVTAGQRVLVHGASGSVGCFAVQIAKAWGAHVTGVCSAANLELVRSLGAERAIDYGSEDYAAEGPVYDVIVDVVGKAGVRRAIRALKPGGTLVEVALAPSFFLARLWYPLIGRARMKMLMGTDSAEDVAILKSMVDEGLLRTVIDREFPLAEIAEAHRLAQSGHKKGHAVVIMPHEAE